MTTLSKDEVVKMAREAGAVFDPRWGVASNTGTATFERFATLCRAPLVAENERLEAEAEAGVFAHGRDMDWLRAERDAAIERADELGADKGTYFRLYEQACIQMTEKDKYGEHYRTLFNNADEANNRLIDERDALRAELGQYPEIQALLMSENKQLRAEVEAFDKAEDSWMRKAIELEAEVAKLRGLVSGRSAEYLAAHITYDKGYQEGRLDAESLNIPVAEVGVSIFTWLGDRPPAGTTLYRIDQL